MFSGTSYALATDFLLGNSPSLKALIANRLAQVGESIDEIYSYAVGRLNFAVLIGSGQLDWAEGLDEIRIGEPGSRDETKKTICHV